MIDRRRLLVVLPAFAVAVAAAAPARAAGPDDDPAGFVGGLYASVTADDGLRGGSDLFSTAEARPKTFTADLCRLWAKVDATVPTEEIGPVDFDLFTASQDAEVRKAEVTVASRAGDRATVRAALFARPPHPGERPQATIDFDLRRESGGWRIDDMSGPAPEGTWSLRRLLAAYRSG